MHDRLFLCFALSLGLSFSVAAQWPTVCPGPLQSGQYCQNLCLSCAPFSFSGNTVGWLPSAGPGFCGTATSTQWLAFVAGENQATVRAVPSNCQNGNGLQLAVYADCASNPLACSPGQAGGGADAIELAVQLIPGKTYYLMVDAYQGDACDFTVSIDPPSAGTPPGLGSTGAIQGLATICPGGLTTYELPADVPGAGFYRWTAPPGWRINGQTGVVTLEAPGGRSVQIIAGSGSGQLSVVPFNACSEGTPATKYINNAPIPPTVLPPISLCPGEFPFILPWGDVAVSPGIYETNLVSWMGCDSIVRQRLILLQVCTVNGKVFADYNSNGLFDGNDIGLANTIVSTSSGHLTTTNFFGNFSFATLPVGDTIWPQINLSGVSVTPAYYIYQGGNQNNLDFAVSGDFGPADVLVSIQNTQVFRPGFSTTIFAVANNYSLTEQQDVVLHLVLPPFLEIQNITPAFSYQIGDTMYWEGGTLPPGQSFIAKVQVLTPATTAIGTPVLLQGWVTPLDDNNPLNNTQQLSRLVIGAYDPNDKQVNPEYVTPAMLANQQRLNYTIRFQNTGNYPADFVKIVDTLQANLDPATFQFIASSHPCTWKLLEPGQVEFLFSDINLPDSVSNEPESHGFVEFSLRPRPGLLVGDQLQNFGDIYFDFNPPVRTNTTSTQVVHFLPGDPFAGSFMEARPNPATYVVHFGWASMLPQAGWLRLYAVNGYLLRETPVAAGASGVDVYVADLPDGIYLARLEAAGLSLGQRIVVQHSGGIRRRMRK